MGSGSEVKVELRNYLEACGVMLVCWWSDRLRMLDLDTRMILTIFWISLSLFTLRYVPGYISHRAQITDDISPFFLSLEHCTMGKCNNGGRPNK